MLCEALRQIIHNTKDKESVMNFQEPASKVFADISTRLSLSEVVRDTVWAFGVEEIAVVGSN